LLGIAVIGSIRGRQRMEGRSANRIVIVAFRRMAGAL
jgi:hypothetical protein